jgi:uncharacterized Zn finger protein (UPF0148 family)
MVWVMYAMSGASRTCPRCDAPLLEMADMWGPVYACDDCGYEVDELDSDGEPHRLQHQLVLSGDSWLTPAPSAAGSSSTWQASDTERGLPWAS